jgi:endoglucanase
LRSAAAIVSSLAALAVAAPAASALPTVIRTGGPTAADERMNAVVASDHNLKGRGFTITRHGHAVFHGTLHAAPGSAAPWRHAYVARAPRIVRSGSFRFRAAGTTSRRWQVRGGGSAKLIPLVLKFFASNSDGFEPSPIHDPSHLHDATIKGGPHDGEHVDLTGGWMDAGDMIKFAQNEAFSAAALEAAARLDPADAGVIGAQADVAIRWLEKLHPFPNVFVMQVGDARDHNLSFRDPAGDDASNKPGIGHRFAYHWKDGVGGDIGGKVATALALAADRASGPRRAQLIADAEDWYAAGSAAHRATPRVRDPFYVDTTWKDSMAAGAVALYRVTGNPMYLSDGRRYLRQFGSGDTWGYYDMSPFAAADLCGALGAPPLGGKAARMQGCDALQSAAQQVRVESRNTAFGATGYISWGTTQTVAAGAAEAWLAAGHAGFRPGRRLAAGGRDYLLGLNPWGASFIVGQGPHSPRKIHSWASVFGDGLPRGAVVGGPASKRQILNQNVGRPRGSLAKFNGKYAYEDRRADYVTSEPTIDSAASVILLLAALRGH